MPGQPDMSQAQQAQFAYMLEQMAAQLDALVEKNKAGFAALERQGIRFDPMQMAAARIDTLIESIASAFGPQGAMWAFQARMDFEKMVEGHIETAGNEGRKAQLAVAGSFTPSMIRQLASETGTFGGDALRAAQSRAVRAGP